MVFCAIIRGKARAKGPVLVCRRVGQEFEFEQFLKLESIPPKTCYDSRDAQLLHGNPSSLRKSVSAINRRGIVRKFEQRGV